MGARLANQDELTFLNKQVDRKCVTTDRPAYNRFEIDGVLSDYVKMTCTDRCLPSGWFVHFEMAVFVRV